MLVLDDVRRCDLYFIICIYIERETCSLAICGMNRKIYDLLTFARDYFAAKKIEKISKFSGSNIFLYRGYCQQIGVRIYRNSFRRRNKYVHV